MSTHHLPSHFITSDAEGRFPMSEFSATAATQQQPAASDHDDLIACTSSEMVFVCGAAPLPPQQRRKVNYRAGDENNNKVLCCAVSGFVRVHKRKAQHHAASPPSSCCCVHPAKKAAAYGGCAGGGAHFVSNNNDDDCGEEAEDDDSDADNGDGRDAEEDTLIDDDEEDGGMYSDGDDGHYYASDDEHDDEVVGFIDEDEEGEKYTKTSSGNSPNLMPTCVDAVPFSYDAPPPPPSAAAAITTAAPAVAGNHLITMNTITTPHLLPLPPSSSCVAPRQSTFYESSAPHAAGGSVLHGGIRHDEDHLHHYQPLLLQTEDDCGDLISLVYAEAPCSSVCPSSADSSTFDRDNKSDSFASSSLFDGMSLLACEDDAVSMTGEVEVVEGVRCGGEGGSGEGDDEEYAFAVATHDQHHQHQCMNDDGCGNGAADGDFSNTAIMMGMMGVVPSVFGATSSTGHHSDYHHHHHNHHTFHSNFSWPRHNRHKEELDGMVVDADGSSWRQPSALTVSSYPSRHHAGSAADVHVGGGAGAVAIPIIVQQGYPNFQQQAQQQEGRRAERLCYILDGEGGNTWTEARQEEAYHHQPRDAEYQRHADESKGGWGEPHDHEAQRRRLNGAEKPPPHTTAALLPKIEWCTRRTGLSETECEARFPYRSGAKPFPPHPTRPTFPAAISGGACGAKGVKCCYYAQRPRKACSMGEKCYHCHDDEDGDVVAECHGDDGKNRNEVRGGAKVEKADVAAATEHAEGGDGSGMGDGDAEEECLITRRMRHFNSDRDRPHVTRAALAALPCQYGQHCVVPRHAAVAKKCGFDDEQLALYKQFVVELRAYSTANTNYRKAVHDSRTETAAIDALFEKRKEELASQRRAKEMLRESRNAALGVAPTSNFRPPTTSCVPLSVDAKPFDPFISSVLAAEGRGAFFGGGATDEGRAMAAPPNAALTAALLPSVDDGALWGGAAAATPPPPHHNDHHSNPNDDPHYYFQQQPTTTTTIKASTTTANHQHSQSNAAIIAPYQRMGVPCLHCGAKWLMGAVGGADGGSVGGLPPATVGDAAGGDHPPSPPSPPPCPRSHAIRLSTFSLYRPNPSYNGVTDTRREVKGVGIRAWCHACARTFAFEDVGQLDGYIATWQQHLVVEEVEDNERVNAKAHGECHESAERAGGCPSHGGDDDGCCDGGSSRTTAPPLAISAAHGALDADAPRCSSSSSSGASTATVSCAFPTTVTVMSSPAAAAAPPPPTSAAAATNGVCAPTTATATSTSAEGEGALSAHERRREELRLKLIAMGGIQSAHLR